MSNYKETGSKAYLYGICAVAVIGGLLFGYDTAVISGAEQALQQFFASGLGDYYTTSLHGFVVSSALIGCIIGGLISGIGFLFPVRFGQLYAGVPVPPQLLLLSAGRSNQRTHVGIHPV